MGQSRIDDPKKYVVHKTHAYEKHHKNQTFRQKNEKHGFHKKQQQQNGVNPCALDG